MICKLKLDLKSPKSTTLEGTQKKLNKNLLQELITLAMKTAAPEEVA
jgi:hypothetical protein